MLLAFGADTRRRDSVGLTPIDMARMMKHESALELLEAHHNQKQNSADRLPNAEAEDKRV